MLAGRDCCARVANAGSWVASRLNHDFDRAALDRREAVVGECCGVDPRRVPAHGAASLARTIRIEIGDDRDLDAWRVRHLRKEHGAELAGTDQCYAHGLACGVALTQQRVQVHRNYSAAWR